MNEIVYIDKNGKRSKKPPEGMHACIETEVKKRAKKKEEKI